ncbi:MAG: TlpA family protein disulfide reductase [Betaproteobacteria bacterium]|nr:TlpA family protein disulfide reductase [Betaproteobacteria bacterium]
MWLAAKEPAAKIGGTPASMEGVNYAAVLAASFPDLEGRPQSLGQWQGKLLFINFWATWCAPCKEEMPMFDNFFRQNAKNGVQIVGIAADTADKVRLFQAQTPVSYPLLPDAEGAVAFSRRMGNRLGMLPHTLVFSPKGDLLLNKIGQLSHEEMALIIRENAPK